MYSWLVKMFAKYFEIATAALKFVWLIWLIMISLKVQIVRCCCWDKKKSKTLFIHSFIKTQINNSNWWIQKTRKNTFICLTIHANHLIKQWKLKRSNIIDKWDWQQTVPTQNKNKQAKLPKKYNIKKIFSRFSTASITSYGIKIQTSQNSPMKKKQQSKTKAKNF